MKLVSLLAPIALALLGCSSSRAGPGATPSSDAPAGSAANIDSAPTAVASTGASASSALPVASASGAPALLAGWERYAPTGAGFSVMLPAHPKLIDIPADPGGSPWSSGPAHAAVAKIGTATYTAVEFGAKKDITNDISIRIELGKALSEKFTGAELHLGDVHLSKAIEATEVRITSLDHERGAVGRTFAVGKHAMIVSAEFPNADKATAEAFLDSIQVER